MLPREGILEGPGDLRIGYLLGDAKHKELSAVSAFRARDGMSFVFATKAWRAGDGDEAVLREFAALHGVVTNAD